MITAVAILNWNGINHLKSFLPSVIENSNDEKVKIIIDTKLVANLYVLSDY